ncbi:hypothetical protein KSP40_PGU006671 [Platanthera guangdongensis]|uniref:Methenyltetrahydrofolate cyclohydrolase n=1 Tax=Platanthera guangdongensis TaxID=2320717 RepID=A0ABR2LDY1_9ASPA
MKSKPTPLSSVPAASRKVEKPERLPLISGSTFLLSSWLTKKAASLHLSRSRSLPLPPDLSVSLSRFLSQSQPERRLKEQLERRLHLSCPSLSRASRTRARAPPPSFPLSARRKKPYPSSSLSPSLAVEAVANEEQADSSFLCPGRFPHRTRSGFFDLVSPPIASRRCLVFLPPRSRRLEIDRKEVSLPGSRATSFFSFSTSFRCAAIDRSLQYASQFVIACRNIKETAIDLQRSENCMKMEENQRNQEGFPERNGEKGRQAKSLFRARVPSPKDWAIQRGPVAGGSLRSPEGLPPATTAALTCLLCSHSVLDKGAKRQAAGWASPARAAPLLNISGEGEIANEVARIKDSASIVPGLAVILVGSRKDSQTYVRNKRKACEEVGIASFEASLPEDCTEEEVIKHISDFNSNPSVHGILVQLPLPRHINEEKVLNAVYIEKDVDGFHPLNIGRLAMQGRDPLFVPCTPKGCMELLHRYDIEIKGKRAVVIGRSNIVGMPAALLLQPAIPPKVATLSSLPVGFLFPVIDLRFYPTRRLPSFHRRITVHPPSPPPATRANATVTIVHSKTQNPEEITRQADILISAAGSPNLVKGSWLKPGAVVIDVGINAVDSYGGEAGGWERSDVDREVRGITGDGSTGGKRASGIRSGGADLELFGRRNGSQEFSRAGGLRRGGEEAEGADRLGVSDVGGGGSCIEKRSVGSGSGTGSRGTIGGGGGTDRAMLVSRRDMEAWKEANNN